MQVNGMRDLGKNIKSLREARGMTQDGFAALLHVTRQTVSNYENGRSQPDLDMLTEIARVLDTDVNALLGAASAPGQADAAAEAVARKRAILRLAISGGLFLALMLVGIPLKEWADAQFRDFSAQPRIYMKIWFYPCVYAIGGWCGMQALEVLCGVHPLQKRWCRYAKWVLPAVMFLPQAGLTAWMSPIASRIPIDIWMSLWTLIKQPVWYGIFGAVLWLLGLFTGKRNDPTA